MLRMDSEPVLDSETYLEQLRGVLAPAMLEAIRGLNRPPPVEPFCPAVKRWNALEVYVRNFVIRNRPDADRRRAEEWTRHEPDVFPGLDNTLNDALNAPDPLEREKRLDHIRWDILEEARFARPFEIDALAVYRCRLLIAEKWAQINPEEGVQNVANVVQSLRPSKQLQEAGVG